MYCPALDNIAVYFYAFLNKGCILRTVFGIIPIYPEKSFLRLYSKLPYVAKN